MNFMTLPSLKHRSSFKTIFFSLFLLIRSSSCGLTCQPYIPADATDEPASVAIVRHFKKSQTPIPDFLAGDGKFRETECPRG
jgi:hypothetical protein